MLYLKHKRIEGKSIKTLQLELNIEKLIYLYIFYNVD
jgi:hypothetical protein